MKSDSKGQMSCESIYLKCPKQANPYRHGRLPGLRAGREELCERVLFGDNENILELEGDDADTMS